MLTIYIDADACPVKDEVYKVARRYGLKVFVVANCSMRVPTDPLIELVVRTGQGFDIVDDWIAEQAEKGDIVITADIPLAARCIEKKSRVLDPRGKAITVNDVGAALAMRDLMETLRQAGEITGGPAPMNQQHKSKFLAKLDETINSVKRDMRGS